MPNASSPTPTFVWNETMMTRILTLAVLLLAAASAQAQSEQVLMGSQITESALIDALAPPEVLTRGLKPSTAPGQPAKPARASLFIEFKTSSTELTAAAREQLAIVGKALKSERLAPLSFQVVGHADPRGNPQSNQKLSEGRAASVRAYLVQDQGVEAKRLTSLGMGDREVLNRENPAAPENRRVQIVRATQ
jgi:outer membrane protein OmpA-like peptidoglycan-associated protein